MVHNNCCHEKSLVAPNSSPKLDLKPIVELALVSGSSQVSGSSRVSGAQQPELSSEQQSTVKALQELSGAGPRDREG